MRLLDRHVLRELLLPFAYCLGGFLVFWIAFDVFSELGEYQRAKLRLEDVLELYLVRTPEFLVMVLPIAFLLALLYALTNLARHNEITAMRAAGRSLLRIALPCLGTGFVLSLAVLAINELWLPDSLEKAENILQRRARGAQAEARRQWETRLGFRSSSATHTNEWLIEAFHLEQAWLLRPHVVRLDESGGRLELLAERGWWETNTWVFTNVNLLIYSPVPGTPPERQQTDMLAVPELTETPDQIRSEVKIKKLTSLRMVRKAQLSIREILDYQRLHPGGTSQDAILETKLHGRLASPWTCLVVVLIALPFGAASGRRNVFVGVASSIVICFTYFVLLQLALALGSSGYVTPWLAAWSPNLFFAVAGLLLTLRVR
ncbi:MAG: hypothetical protein RJA22_1722 [Verrucomicrobiota bacterium]|jgi:LPS export ABC transporter permease LptG